MLKTWANIWLSLDLCCSIILFIPTFDPSKDRHTDLPDEANTFLFVGPRLHHRSFSPKRLKEGCKDQKTLGFGWVMLGAFDWLDCMILDDSRWSMIDWRSHLHTLFSFMQCWHRWGGQIWSVKCGEESSMIQRWVLLLGARFLCL